MRDYERWQQNPDGSWSRRLTEYSEVGVVDATSGAVTAAEELGVDLSTIEGTGAGGKVTKADVVAAAEAEEEV